MTKNNIGIVVANYYNEYTEKLLNGATSTLDGSFNYEVFSVPGAGDTVDKINSLVDTCDRFSAIGLICKGETED